MNVTKWGIIASIIVLISGLFCMFGISINCLKLVKASAIAMVITFDSFLVYITYKQQQM